MSELNGFWFPVSNFSSQIQILSYLAPSLFLCFFPIPQRLPDPGEDCGRQCQSLHRDCWFQVWCSVFLNCPLRSFLRRQPELYGGENRAGGRGAPPSCDSGVCLGQLCSALVLKEDTALSCVCWKEETDVTLVSRACPYWSLIHSFRSLQGVSEEAGQACPGQWPSTPASPVSLVFV